MKNMHLYSRRLLLSSLLFLLTGCLSPISLKNAVSTYDEATTSAISRQLLTNIARAHHHQPIHFTAVSNVAATFDFRFSAGATPAAGGLSGNTLMPIFGGSVAENPTISIVPIEGEEFTRRLLTPFQQNKFMLLLRQHFDIDLLLRLMAQEVRIYNHSAQATYRNDPTDKTGYEMFRKIVLHLSAIQDQNQLQAEPLNLEHSWTLPVASVSAEGFHTLESKFSIRHDPENALFILHQKKQGPILITNYDPSTLSEDEREQLSEETMEWDPNDVVFDIRPAGTGGKWPMKGIFRLRSFHAIISALGQSLGDKPEHYVEKDPRTPPILRNENPNTTMDILVSDTPPPNADLLIHAYGKYYAVNNQEPYTRWNRDAFQMLYLLFQMTVTDLPHTSVPGITIAK